MGKQTTIEFYGKGISKTKSGHLRYHSPKELRGKYVHRVVVDRLIEDTPYSLRLFIPWPYEVHHVDYNKENNCPCNFILLSDAFHSLLTSDRPRGPNGQFGTKFHPKWKPAPAWRLFADDIAEVPF